VNWQAGRQGAWQGAWETLGRSVTCLKEIPMRVPRIAAVTVATLVCTAAHAKDVNWQ
jgi:hypothetical protein